MGAGRSRISSATAARMGPMWHRKMKRASHTPARWFSSGTLQPWLVALKSGWCRAVARPDAGRVSSPNLRLPLQPTKPLFAIQLPSSSRRHLSVQLWRREIDEMPFTWRQPIGEMDAMRRSTSANDEQVLTRTGRSDLTPPIGGWCISGTDGAPVAGRIHCFQPAPPALRKRSIWSAADCLCRVRTCRPRHRRAGPQRPSRPSARRCGRQVRIVSVSVPAGTSTGVSTALPGRRLQGRHVIHGRRR